MKISATGRGEIEILLTMEEAGKVFVDHGEARMEIEDVDTLDVLDQMAKALRREDELQQDMEAQMAEERRQTCKGAEMATLLRREQES